MSCRSSLNTKKSLTSIESSEKQPSNDQVIKSPSSMTGSLIDCLFYFKLFTESGNYRTVIDY